MCRSGVVLRRNDVMCRESFFSSFFFLKKKKTYRYILWCLAILLLNILHQNCTSLEVEREGNFKNLKFDTFDANIVSIPPFHQDPHTWNKSFKLTIWWNHQRSLSGSRIRLEERWWNVVGRDMFRMATSSCWDESVGRYWRSTRTR